MDYDIKLNERQTITCIQRISNILLINGGFSANPRLCSGEMCLALFFWYAHFTQNKLYSNYGFKLIKVIQTGINLETSIDYKKGLTGLGSTVEYLVQTSFVETDTNNILDDFDKQIFSSLYLHFFYSPPEEFGINRKILKNIYSKFVLLNRNM